VWGQVSKGNEMISKILAENAKNRKQHTKKPCSQRNTAKKFHNKMEKQVSLGSSFSEGSFHHSNFLP